MALGVALPVGSIGPFLLGILAMLVLGLLSAETRGWMPHVARTIVRHASRLLPESERARYLEEWEGDLEFYSDRPLSVIGVAVRIWVRARATAREAPDRPDAESSQQTPTRATDRSASRVLGLTSYCRLLAAYTLNELAWAIGSLTLAVLVYRRTGSALGATAYFLAAQFVPALIAPAVVIRLDRVRARFVLPSLYVVEALAFAALSRQVVSFSLMAVLALTLLDGAAALAARSLARATTVAVIAPAGLLREGNALTNASFSVCFMAGPALGGALVVAGGAGTALSISSGLFVLIALTLLTAPGLPDPAPSDAPARVRLRAGIAYARGHPGIRALLSLQGAAVVFFTISVPVDVVFARSLHTGAAGYGALLSAWGAGAIAGSAVYARWRGVAGRVLIALGAGLLGMGFVIMAGAPTITMAVAGSAIGGAGNGIEVVAARTELQEQTEAGWMALIMSLADSIMEAAPGLGIVAGGALAALSGPRVALAVGGAGALLIPVGALTRFTSSSGRLQ